MIRETNEQRNETEDEGTNTDESNPNHCQFVSRVIIARRRLPFSRK
jgi:hypothetical protein